MDFPWAKLLISILSGLLGAWGASAAGWTAPEVAMSGITLLAAALWVTEAVPAFAAALVVLALEIVFLTEASRFGLMAEGTRSGFASLLAAVADPVMLLFFSGFVLAKAAEKERVDLVVGGLLLRPFAATPRRLLLGVIGVTAIFSMWMSNTATTAFMLTLIGPVLAQIPENQSWRKGLVLAVPFAASIGGMSTPMSTPPNALAMGYLDRIGQPMSVAGWMAYGLPLALVMLAITAVVLSWLFPPPAVGKVVLDPPGRLPLRGKITVGAFVITVLLWMTEPLHGVPAAVAALLPVVALLVAGVVGRKEINALDWDVLILLAGGLALGWGISTTGLDVRIAGWLPAGAGTSAWLFGAVATVTLVLGTFLSNTAVANLILPIAVAGVGTNEQTSMALTVAFTASLTMALPISGPPNAMAFARGGLQTRDMVIPGTLLGVIGTVLALLLARLM